VTTFLAAFTHSAGLPPEVFLTSWVAVVSRWPSRHVLCSCGESKANEAPWGNRRIIPTKSTSSAIYNVVIKIRGLTMGYSCAQVRGKDVVT